LAANASNLSTRKPAPFKSAVGGDFSADRVLAPAARNPRVVESHPASEAERSRRDRADLRVLVAHRADRGHPVRHALLAVPFVVRQPALGGRRRAHAARRAHRRAVLPRAAHAGKRRREVFDEPGGARLVPDRDVGQRGAHPDSREPADGDRYPFFRTPRAPQLLQQFSPACGNRFTVRGISNLHSSRARRVSPTV
jgi:hypothetical protein